MAEKWFDPSYPEETPAFKESVNKMAEQRRSEMEERRRETLNKISVNPLNDVAAMIVAQVAYQLVNSDGSTVEHYDSGSRSVNLKSDVLNVVLEEAGIKGIEGVSYGSCNTCRFSESGRERGYRWPCVKCRRPQHDYHMEK